MSTYSLLLFKITVELRVITVSQTRRSTNSRVWPMVKVQMVATLYRVSNSIFNLDMVSVGATWPCPHLLCLGRLVLLRTWSKASHCVPTAAAAIYSGYQRYHRQENQVQLLSCTVGAHSEDVRLRSSASFGKSAAILLVFKYMSHTIRLKI